MTSDATKKNGLETPRRQAARKGRSLEGAGADASLNELLATRGLRFTPQRQQVYQVLMEQRDHPTAEEIFMRAKRGMPDISIATVYNCLDALVKCRVVRQVTVERGATRFCPNMREHCHFHCDHCNGVYDVDLPEEPGLELPRGFKAERFDIAIHGRCPACSNGSR
jgi:Fur family peroxide stress response transcriptional regulator